MVYASISEAYGDSWKQSGPTAQTRSDQSPYASCDPYFDEEAQKGFTEQIEQLKSKIEHFTHKAQLQKPVTKETFVVADTVPVVVTTQNPKSTNKRLENIINYTLMAIFASLIIENAV